MKLSAKSRYGLRACYILAENYPEHVSATALEKGINVSNKYIEKIMRVLTKESIVSAERGVNGGYSLAKAPKDVTIGDIVRTLEDDIEIIECVKKDTSCKCCPSKKVWQNLYDGINKLLDEMNLEQVLKGEI
jgi:Rrf2 family protein